MVSIRAITLVAGLLVLGVVAELPEECAGGACITDDEEAAHFVQKNAQTITSMEVVDESANLESAWVAATGCSGILCNGNCPITQNPTKDGGCCNSGWIGTGRKSCVRISSSNILKYSCGLSGTPSCKNDASFFSNKDKVEKCTLDGQSCTYTKYGWWSRKINIGGGNKAEKLSCTCEDVPTYRRQDDDSAWALGLLEVENNETAAANDSINETEILDIKAEEASAWVAATGCSGILCNGNCPITQNPTKDGGCCNSGWIGTGRKSCVRISSSNILKYSCGLSGTPSCKNDASFFSNKDKEEKCTLDGQSCTYTKYGWWARKIDISGGNKAEKLSCTCEDVPTYRRQDDDSTWALGLNEVENTVK